MNNYKNQLFKKVMIFRKFLLLSCALLAFNASFGQTKIGYKKHTAFVVQKWEVIDIDFKAKAPKDPFESKFEAEFTHNGKKINVPGFYNGDNHWVIRFSASEEGSWQFVTSSSIKPLNGKAGTVRVTPNTIVKHGAITIDPKNPQKFAYEDGTPYFLLAFECDWLFALDYANNQAIPKTNHLLTLLNQNGLNQVVMNVFTYDVKWPKDKRLKDYPQYEFGATPGAFPFLGDNKNPDYSALNVDFFKKLDRVISSMNDRQIISHLMIYVWNKLVNWPEMGSKADNMYFDYVIKRYQAFPNIIWDVSKEALGYGHNDENYIVGRINRIRESDAFKRLVTVHDYRFCSDHSDLVDFISIQNWQHDIYNVMMDVWKKFPNKPIFNIEHGGYEESPFVVFTGDYINPEYCLRRNYECIFAGGYSTYYWQGTSWNVIIYNPFEQTEGFQKPKFRYYKNLQDFFDSVDFNLYKPSPSRNSGGYSLTSDQGNTLIYVPKENYKVGAPWMRKEKGTYTLQWINTLTGERTMPQTVKNEGFRSPWSGTADAILKIDRTN